MHPSLKIFDSSVKDLIHIDFEIETLANDCIFTEGPVWNKEGFYLFSDITANCIYQIAPGKSKEVYLEKSGTDDVNHPDLNKKMIGSNGLAYNKNGDLLICRHGSHDVAIYKNTNQPLIKEYEEAPLNSPNDLAVHSNGSIFFSDPPYGLKDGIINSKKFQKIAGVYCYNKGDVKLICAEYKYPNGVCLSPDETKLYICSNKSVENFIMEYDAQSLDFNKIFAHENSDGIKSDKKGNLFLCNKEGILILNEKGKRIALIKLPAIPANICWGGNELNDLFISARENIFLIKGLQKN